MIGSLATVLRRSRTPSSCKGDEVVEIFPRIKCSSRHIPSTFLIQHSASLALRPIYYSLYVCFYLYFRVRADLLSGASELAELCPSVAVVIITSIVIVFCVAVFTVISLVTISSSVFLVTISSIFIIFVVAIIIVSRPWSRCDRCDWSGCDRYDWRLCDR